MRAALKWILYGVGLLLVMPLALLCLFGRQRALFSLGGQLVALLPGLPGDYLRICFYRLTLQACSLDSRISFGSFFAHPDTEIAAGVSIGAYCILGRTRIGTRTQIASGVQILSGARQHGRNAEGQIEGAETGVFEKIEVGSDCWIGAGAIVMAPVGSRSTIGAGSIVNKEIAPNSVAVGNPAKVIRSI